MMRIEWRARCFGWIVVICMMIALVGCQQKERMVSGPDLYPAFVSTEEGPKWGYVNHKGIFVIEPQFSMANDFQTNGLAIVQMDERFGVVNQKGETVIEAKYEGIRPFVDGLSNAWLGDQLLLDEKGNSLFSTNEWIGDFSDGFAVFAERTEKGDHQYGYINQAGEVVIQAQYLNATPFHQGKAVVQRKENDYALINIEGTVLQEFHYPVMGAFRENRIAFRDDAGKWGYLDEKGQVVIAPQFDIADSFENGIAIVNADLFSDAHSGVIRQDGSFIIQPEYSSIQRLGNGLLAIGKPLHPKEAFLGAKYALAKEDGAFLTDFLYYEVNKFDRGLLSVCDRDSTFFLDEKGQPWKEFSPVPGRGTLSYDGRVVKALVDNETFYLTREGKTIWVASADVTLANGVTVVKTKHRPNRNILTYYPQLTGLTDAAVQDQVNRRLKEAYTKVTAPADADLYYNYTGDYEIHYAVGNLLVLGLTGYDYPFGAAHGTPVREYFHIDLTSGQFYQLQDLFQPGSDYVTRINTIIRSLLEKEGEEMGVFPGEFNGIHADQPWIVSKDGLQVYFGVYEIAPYAAGFPTFTIPLEGIMDLVNVDHPLWKSMSK